jgi:hypothetical protein
LIGDPQIWYHAGNSLANNVGTSVDGGVHVIWMEADHEDGVSASSDKTLIWSTTSNVACRIVNDSRESSQEQDECQDYAPITITKHCWKRPLKTNKKQIT